jgi:RNA polymerase sigma factor (sigma-70 family)
LDPSNADVPHAAMGLVRSSKRSDPTSLVAVVSHELAAATAKEQQFRDMYSQTLGRAMNYATRLVGHDAAADAVHDATLEIWTAWDTLQPEQHTARYFMGRVARRVLDRIERDTRHIELTEELEQSVEFIDRITGASNEFAEIDLRPIVDRILQAMPLRSRVVLLLVRDYEFTQQEFADRLGITASAVEKRIERGHHFARKCFDHAGLTLSEGSMLKLLSSRSESRNE